MTAIRVFSTLLRPDAGRAFVGGYDVVREPGEVRRLIGLTGQYAAVDKLLLGQENLFPDEGRGRACGPRPFPRWFPITPAQVSGLTAVICVLQFA